MEFLLNRYRNLTVLLIVIVVQLLLIAYQVRTSNDVPLIRVWAVTAVTPIERVLEVVRQNTWGFVDDYFVLLHTRRQNDELRNQIGQLKLENQFLKTELATADRVKALSLFQARSQSKTLAARIIGNATGANSKAVFIDRGSGSGVESGMAVVTPDGIVGKVVSAYPTASLVLLITDANFAAGVISQKSRVHGTLKGQGHDGTVLVDYIQNEEKVDPGEWFYTSGDDRIFPKGFPVGQVTTVRNGRLLKEVYVAPSGFQGGLEEVLVVLEAVHQPIPDVEVASPGYKLTSAPPASSAGSESSPLSGALVTDADKLKQQYRDVGDAEHHTFGEGLPGSTPPDFTKLPGLKAPVPGKPNVSGGNGAPGPAPKEPVVPKSGAPNAAPPAAAPKLPITAPVAKPKPTPERPAILNNDPETVQPDSAGQGVAKPPVAPRPKPNTLQ
jgi:rod shape-determining protein MreC